MPTFNPTVVGIIPEEPSPFPTPTLSAASYEYVKIDPMVEQFKLGLVYAFGTPKSQPTEIAMTDFASGFYVGANAGRSLGNFSSDIMHSVQTYVDIVSDMSQINQINTVSNGANFDWNGQGLNGGLFVGYVKQLSPRFSLAAELNGSLDSLSGKFQTNSLQVDTLTNSGSNHVYSHVKMRGMISESLLPGFHPNNMSTLFGRIGLVSVKRRFPKLLLARQLAQDLIQSLLPNILTQLG